MWCVYVNASATFKKKNLEIWNGITASRSRRRRKKQRQRIKIQTKQRVRFGYFSLPFLCCTFDWELHSKRPKKCAHKAHKQNLKRFWMEMANNISHSHTIKQRKKNEFVWKVQSERKRILVLTYTRSVWLFENLNIGPNTFWLCGQKIVILEQSVSKMWHILLCTKNTPVACCSKHHRHRRCSTSIFE